MTTHSKQALKLIEKYSEKKSFGEVLQTVKQKDPATLPVLPELDMTIQGTAARIHYLQSHLNISLDHLAGITQDWDALHYKGNIEHFIGHTKVPTGLAGPLYINGTAANGDFFIPLATTEGALVASYNRGAKATRLSGGITSVCTTEALQRSPIWKFNSLAEVGVFVPWLLQQTEIFKRIAGENSRYACLEEVKLNMEGNNLLTIFEFTCGDAAGQNMVTICTEAICRYILEQTPVKPQYWFLESNYSGDKKATAVSFTSVRGKKVTTEALVKKEIVTSVLNSTPNDIATYWQCSIVAASQSGSIGSQGHAANGLTALFLACGQDVACVSEASVGITRMEVTKTGDLYVAVTLPSLVVGTVGGGTSLPTQQECLQILNCTGTGSARKFAEICGALVLAGELSIAAALASGQFGKAHKLFRRKPKQ